MKENKKRKKIISPMAIIALINFLIIIILSLYIIYLRFIPYETLNYDGYAISGKDIVNNLLDTTFDVEENIQALKVSDQDMIYKNLRSFYLGASKTQNINLDYPIYVNDKLALYNLSQNVSLVTSDLEIEEGYKGFTLTSGALYNSDTLERADFCNYILMKNSDNLYINTKEIKIKTYANEYKIPMNSIINFTDKFITYYTLDGDYFVYGKIIDIDNESQVIIEDYNKNYTYKELLIALGIIRPEIAKKEIIKEDLTKKEPEKKEEDNKKENNTENTIIPETIIENNIIIDNQTNESNENNNNNDNNNNTEIVWIKPEVSATNFAASTYIALNTISIYDPSGTICKAPTFTFYRNNEISFRISANSSGILRATKLSPNTTYKIVGTYQYINKEGEKIEVTFFKDEITTLGTENIKTIDLSFENGEIFSNKIQLKNFGITSDITDEAIYGVTRATIELNGKEYKISSLNLNRILKGNIITYETAENLISNTKYDYIIRFYDTNNNEMKLNNNTGKTNTLKAEPTVKITTKVDPTKVTINTVLNNIDNVEMSNYRYEIISNTGEVCKQGDLNSPRDKVICEHLEMSSLYIINVFADYDIEDGKGMQLNKLIGSEIFITEDVNKLGNLKLNIENDEENLSYNQAILTVNLINRDSKDDMLIKILSALTIKLQNNNSKKIEKEIIINSQDLIKLQNGENIDILAQNLESNTEYSILVYAKIKQASEEKAINSQYNIKSFTTNKKPASMMISNLIITDNLINMKFIIDDEDNAIGDSNERLVNINLSEVDKNGNETSVGKSLEKYLNKEGKEFDLEYSSLTKESTYRLSCIAAKYNETNQEKNIRTNYFLMRNDRTQEDEDSRYFELKTEGLTGEVILTSLKEEIKEDEDGNYISYNLVNVKSENNWYSECFDTLESDKEYNYKKVYDANNKVLTLGSNQSYAYNLNGYDKLNSNARITMSFDAKVSDKEAIVKIQNSKKMNGTIVNEINFDSNTEYKHCSYTFELGNDKYVGFYLPQIEKTHIEEVDGEEKTITQYSNYELYVKNLQIKISDENEEYKDFQSNLVLNAKYELLENQDFTKLQNYYIRLSHINGEEQVKDTDIKEVEVTTDDIKNEDNSALKEALNYIIKSRPEQETSFKLELIIKLYDREFVLDDTEFTYIPGKCEEIESLGEDIAEATVDFLDIQPNGSYILLNNISLTKSKTESQYTFGNKNISFNGNIDFSGNTLYKTTYSSEKEKDVTPYVFYKISNTAKLQNIVIDFEINNKTSKDYEVVYSEDDVGSPSNEEKETKLKEEVEKGIYSLFLYNEGTISNVILNLQEFDDIGKRLERKYVGLLGYNNSGTIDRFIINLTHKLWGTQYISGGVLYSSGIIQNGYIYGSGGIESFGSITNYDTRYFAGIAYKIIGNNAKIQNVYNNSMIKLNYIKIENAFASNIVYRVGNNASLSNVFSINPTMANRMDSNETFKPLDVNKNEVENGPNVFRNTGNVSNSFYFSDTYYSNDINIQGNISSLRDPKFQQSIIGKDGFEYRENYYPIVKMNSCMPTQNWINVGESEKDNINILSARVIEGENKDEIVSNIKDTLEETFGKGQYITGENGVEAKIENAIAEYENTKGVHITDSNIYIAEISLYNTRNSEIDESNGLDIDYVDEKIIGQGKGNQRTLLYAIVDNPQVCYNRYNISRITYKTWVNSADVPVYGPVDVLFGENEPLGKKQIDMKFIKYISQPEEWCDIDQDILDNNKESLGVSGLQQNYRIIKDLDFSTVNDDPCIQGIFQGEIIGEKVEGTNRYPILKNISRTGQDENLIKHVNGKVENLNIDGFTQNSPSKIEDNKYYLGFIGYASENSTINNIHLKDVELELTNDIISGSNCYIGGIVSESGSKNIKNCSVNTIVFKPEWISVPIKICFGGIAGYIKNASTISNCYTQNIDLSIGENITSDGIGGIVGRMNASGAIVNYCYSTGNIVGFQEYIGGIYGYAASSEVTRCYSMVDITSNFSANNKGYIGGIGGHNSGTNNYTLYLGNLYYKKSNNTNISNIVGNAAYNTSSTLNYANGSQRINGLISSSATNYGATLISKVSKPDNRKYTASERVMNGSFKGNYFDNNPINDEGYIVDSNLPRLYENENSNEYMIWQDNVVLSNIDIKVVGNQATPIEDGKKGKITITIENPDKVKVTGFTFEEYKDPSNGQKKESLIIDGSLTQVDNGNRSTISFNVTPNFYYDVYKIEKIKFNTFNQETGEYNTNEQSMTIDVRATITFYKDVNNWNDFDYINSGQNYKINKDINLKEAGIKQEDGYLSKTNLIVGRLVGVKNNENVCPKIYGDITSGDTNNFTFKIDNSKPGLLIKECINELKDLSFENITINSSINDTGIFGKTSADCDNLTFKNIEINASSKNNIGCIAIADKAKINNINLDEIQINKGGDYTGGLLGKATLVGTTNENIHGTNICVQGKTYVGGLIGFASSGGTLKNISAYQKPTSTYLVYGTGNHIGGCLGRADINVDTATVSNSTIKGGGYIGGCIGWANWKTFKNLTTTNNTITGGTRVGGAIGYAQYYLGKVESTNNQIIASAAYSGGVVGHWTSGRTTGEKITCENNTIIGRGSYVGGVAGYLQTSYDINHPLKNVESKNNIVEGKNTYNNYVIDYVGGVFGYLCQGGTTPISDVVGIENKVRGRDYVGGIAGAAISTILRNTKVIDSNTPDKYIEGRFYVGGITGRQTYTSTSTDQKYYSINQAYVSNMNIKGSKYIGGIAGSSVGTVYGVFVEKSNIIGGTNSQNVGGLIGYYTGSTATSHVGSKNFYLKNSACIDTTIGMEEGDSLGGIVGAFQYGNIENCYVANCKIAPTSTSNVIYVGGIVGHLINKDTQSDNYVSGIKNNFVVNYLSEDTYLSGKDYIGGVIGKIDRIIENDSSKDTEFSIDKYPNNKYGSNLIVTDIFSINNNVSMGIGNYNLENGEGPSNQNLKMFNTYIYLGNTINGSRIDTKETYGTDSENEDIYKIIDYNWLQIIDNYKTKLTFGSAFTVDSNHIDAEKFPSLKQLSNWEGLGINQKLYNFPEKVYFTRGTPTKSASKPSLAKSASAPSLTTSVKEQFPKVYIYTSDIDKINIEFEYENKDVQYALYTEGGDLIYSGPINERVNTFTYDFNKSLSVKLYNGIVWYEETFDINNIRNKLYINGDEYLYLLNNKLYSNQREFDGEFINLYEGQVLSLDSKVYDLTNINNVIREVDKIELLEKSTPIVEYDYYGKKIETYYHCTKVMDTDGNMATKDKQMYLKNKVLYILDGSLDIYGNMILVDSYNDKQIETALGTDGKIYNFLTKIKCPLGFKNRDIIAMTSNARDNENIVLVYYSSGKVYGFNYITGEEVFDNGEGKVDILKYLENSFNLDNLLYDIEDISYEHEEELISKLEKVSVDQALQDIENSQDIDNTSNTENNEENTNSKVNNNSTTNSQEVQYVISYDAGQNEYVVYSSEELLNTDSNNVVSENQKIKSNAKLENYYGNLSVSKFEVTNIGVVLIVIVILSIGIILVIMKRKNIK